MEQIHQEDCWSENEFIIRHRAHRVKTPEITNLGTEQTVEQGSASMKLRSSIKLRHEGQNTTPDKHNSEKALKK